MSLDKQGSTVCTCNTVHKSVSVIDTDKTTHTQTLTHTNKTLRLQVMRLILNIIFSGVIVILAYKLALTFR